MEKYFSSQQDDENVIIVIRKHWFELIPHLFAAGFIYFLGILMVFIFPLAFPVLVEGIAYNFYILITSLIFLFNTAYLFSAWLIHYLNVGIITTEHVVDINQDSLFSRKISQLGLDKIQDVSASQKGITETFFNFGNVEIQTAGELPNFIFEKVPSPNETAQKLMELEEEFSNRHGIRTGGAGPEEKDSIDQSPNIEYPVNNEKL